MGQDNRIDREHPNLKVIQRIDLKDPCGTSSPFSDDVVWHYFNPRLPELQGDYVGKRGVEEFFQRLASRTNGTFQVRPISVEPVGDELLVMQTRNSLRLDDEEVAIDVVLVWRVIGGQIVEVWDIPSAFHKSVLPEAS
ncbi:MAG: nuclear transport factor 2 family protein [Planctomycetota bacterium]